MRANYKIHFHGVTPGPRGEIPINRDVPSRLFGSVVLPEELAGPPAAAVCLVIRSIRSLGGLSMTVGSRVIPRHGSRYSPGVEADEVLDLSIPQSESETRTLQWSGGDLPNATPGALLLIEVTFFGQYRVQTQADGELLAAILTIDIPSAGAHAHDHGELAGLGDDDHPGYLTPVEGDLAYSALGHGHVAPDHGALSGLAEDDHTQYHNDARALTWLGARSIADLATKTHALLSSLDDDDHTQYPLLAGRAGGQTVKGGTAASEKLILESSNHATKGDIDLISADITHVAAARHRMVGQNRFRYLNILCTAVAPAQAIVNATDTPLAFTAADAFDTDAIHDTGTNPSRFTFNIAGKYLLTGYVTWDMNAVGLRLWGYSQGGAGINITDVRGAISGFQTIQNFSIVVGASAGGYVQFRAYQTSGGDLNCSSIVSVYYVGE